MGFACPVCDAPQADGEHLANHMAFSAILGRVDHERWLDDHAPGWSEDSPEALAAEITEYVEEVEFPQVFEESGVDHGSHEHGLEDGPASAGTRTPAQPLTEEDEAIIQEARELTREMHDRRIDHDESGGGKNADGKNGDGGEAGENGNGKEGEAGEIGSDEDGERGENRGNRDVETGETEDVETTETEDVEAGGNGTDGDEDSESER